MAFCVFFSGGSRPSDGGGGGEGDLDPEIRRGAVSKVWSKNKGSPGPTGPPPLDPPLFLLQFRVSKSAIVRSDKSVKSSALF